MGILSLINLSIPSTHGMVPMENAKQTRRSAHLPTQAGTPTKTLETLNWVWKPDLITQALHQNSRRSSSSTGPPVAQKRKLLLNAEMVQVLILVQALDPVEPQTHLQLKVRLLTLQLLILAQLPMKLLPTDSAQPN